MNDFRSDRKVLVTGGAGFIGSHLVESLVSVGARVTVVDNLSTGRLSNLESVLSRVELVIGELGDVLRINRVDVDDYSHIFHLAGNPYIPPSVEFPFFDFQQNLYNTFMLLEAVRSSKRATCVLNASSAAVYGNPARLPILEIDPTVPISPYGVSKLAAERYVAVYSQIYGIRAVSMRFFSVYGPRQHKQVVYDLISKLTADPNRIQVYGDGSQERDFAYVSDVVQAMMVAVVRAPCQGEAYNVASGTSVTIANLVAALGQIGGLTPEVVYTGHVRPGDADKWIVDISRLRQLGYEAQTSLQAGLQAVWDWYKQQEALEKNTHDRQNQGCPSADGWQQLDRRSELPI